MVRTAAYGKLGVGFDSSSTVTYQLRRSAANKPPSTESSNGQHVSSKNVLWRTDPSTTSAATTTAGYISAPAGSRDRDVSNRDRDVVDWMMAVKTSHHHSSSTSSSAGVNANSSSISMNSTTSTHHPSPTRHHLNHGGNNYHHHHHHHPRHQDHQHQPQTQTRATGGAGIVGSGGVAGFASGFGGLFKIKPAAGAQGDSRELRTTPPASNTSSSYVSIVGAGSSRSNLSTSSAAREEKKRELTKATSNKYEYGRSSACAPGASPGAVYSGVGPAHPPVQCKQEKGGGDDDNRSRGARPVPSSSSNESQGAVRPPVSVAVVIPTTGGGDWSGGKKGFDLGDTTSYFSRPSRGTSGCSSPSSPSSPFSPFSNSSVSSSSSSPQPHPLPNFPYDFSYSTRAYENKLCEGLERGLYGISSTSHWPSSYTHEPPRRTGAAATAGFGGGGYYEHEREGDSGAGFMSVCDLCAKRLGQNADIYIYRGEKAFCSAECRQQVIQSDQAAAASSTCGSAPATVGRRGGRVGLI